MSSERNLRWIDIVGCHACDQVSEVEELEDGGFFVSPKCGSMEFFCGSYFWPMGSTLGGYYVDEEGNRVEIPEPKFPSFDPPAKPGAEDPTTTEDSKKYPPAQAPLGSDSTPVEDPSWQSMAAAGTACLVLLGLFALSAAGGAFESIANSFEEPPPPVYRPTPEELAAREAEEAADAARERDVDSIVRNWPEELSRYKKAARYINAYMATDEYEDGTQLPYGTGGYRAERGADGEMRFVRVDDQAEQATEEAGEVGVDVAANVDAPSAEASP